MKAEITARLAPEWRVLVLVTAVFSAVWLVTASLLALVGAERQAFIGSGLLFGGFILCWVITVFVLRYKNPDYVTNLLKVDADEKKK